MNRRRFLLVGSALGGGVVLFGAAGSIGHRVLARSQLRVRLLAEASPLLDRQVAEELESIPAQACADLRRYFHGKCLNVEGFVQHTRSTTFTERLGRCRTPEERETCFLQAFCRRVVSEAEILDQVKQVATNMGKQLDEDWDRTCTSLATDWNVPLQPYGGPVSEKDLSARLTELVRAGMRQAAQAAVGSEYAPALAPVAQEIGKSALMLLPLVRSGKPGLLLGIPLFLLFATRPVWGYLMARAGDRLDDYQFAVSGRLAQLANEVGQAFEGEVRQRLVDLHAWQRQAVCIAVERLVAERFGFWGDDS